MFNSLTLDKTLFYLFRNVLTDHPCICDVRILVVRFIRAITRMRRIRGICFLIISNLDRKIFLSDALPNSLDICGKPRFNPHTTRMHAVRT